jgi:hypothetical protein
VAELEDRVVPSLFGQQLFPSDNPWNQNISNAPLASNSAQIIAHIGSSIHIHPDWGADNPANGTAPLYGIPFNVVHGNSTAKINVTIDNYPGESDITPVPIPAGAVIEGDYQNGPNPNGGGYNAGQRGDSHLLVWDEDNNVAYELYGVTRPSDPTLFPNTSGVELKHTDGLWHAAQETVWNMNTDTFRTLGDTSADAAGLSILAGLVRPDEGLTFAQGGQAAITHALRFTLPSGDVDPQYVYPASHIVNVSQGANSLPFGSRLRLQNTPAVNSLIASMPPESQIIAHAMQQYGLILADIGSAMYVTGSSATINTVDSPNTDLTWNLNDIFASNGLKVLTAADFDVVNLTPIVTGLSASSGAAGSSITITGQNFSGAAGQLYVKFGNNLSPSVTYVDDSHITAVVPAGSGTVGVTVQSGVVESDNNSSNPNANVNEPVWGYGTSSAATAPQFTYGGQTVSGANSTVSFATSTVASGNTDLLTIVVKDTTGAAVSGLGSSSFVLGLSGGASAGTFSAVTETATHGTYTSAFTATTAGTASTLTTTINGVTLTAQPTITVTAGAVNGTNSTVSFASPTVASGNTDLVTIVVKDAAGNAISGLGSGAFGFALSGGSSAGSFGAVSESATPGTYTSTFTATTAGSTATLTATISGVTLNSKPTVHVTSGGVSSANSSVSFASPTVASGNTDLVTIVVKDAAGNAITGLASGAFGFALYGGTSAGSFGAVSESATPGTYTSTFTATTAGSTATLTATVSGVTLNSKPTVQVTSGGVSSSNSSVSFASPTVASGNTDLVTIVIKDAAGNAITGLGSGAFSFALSGGTSAGSFGTVTETATLGTYTSTFSATTPGSTATLTSTVSGVTLNSTPSVQVTSGGVSSSNSSVSFASPSAASGNTDLVTIVVKDGAGDPISGLSSGAFSLALSGGTSAGSLSAVSATSTPGAYTSTFTASTAGTASTLTTTVSGVTLASMPTVQVTAGAISGGNSTVSFAIRTVASGKPDAVTIVIKDTAGNPIAGLAASAFSFVLSGGTSTGAFSAVSATSTPGSYSAVFTGTIAGTASTLTTTVGGVTLAAKPTITVTAGAVSATNSTDSFASSSVAVGKTDKLTIKVKDSAGNVISGLASSAFHFSLAGGTSAGTFGPVTETTTKGTYTVNFTGTTAGTTTTLTTVINGVTLSGKPTITVTRGPKPGAHAAIVQPKHPGGTHKHHHGIHTNGGKHGHGHNGG